MIEHFKKINYLKHYIADKEEEFKKHNNESKHDTNFLINGKHLTNIACFWTYIEEYLKSNPRMNPPFLEQTRKHTLSGLS